MQDGKIIAYFRCNLDIKLSNAPQKTPLRGDYSWKDRDNGHDDMHRFCTLTAFVTLHPSCFCPQFMRNIAINLSSPLMEYPTFAAKCHHVLGAW